MTTYTTKLPRVKIRGLTVHPDTAVALEKLAKRMGEEDVGRPCKSRALDLLVLQPSKARRLLAKE